MSSREAFFAAAALKKKKSSSEDGRFDSGLCKLDVIRRIEAIKAMPGFAATNENPFGFGIVLGRVGEYSNGVIVLRNEGATAVVGVTRQGKIVSYTGDMRAITEINRSMNRHRLGSR